MKLPSIKKTKLHLIVAGTIILTSINSYCQKNLSEEAAFLWKIKLDSLPIKLHTEEYIYRFEKDNYRLFKNDEFEMHKAKIKLTEMVDKLPENEVYSVKHITELEAYDFDLKGFKCVPVKEGAQIPLLDYSFGARLPTNSAIAIQFLNSAEINLLPIDEEKASIFIKERKNYKNGKIDRLITLNISFILNGIYSTENVTNKSNYTLTANILQIDFFDNNELTHDPLGSVSTALKSKIDKEEKLKASKLNPTQSASINDSLTSEIKNILSNSTLNDDTKAILIQSALRLYNDTTPSSNTNN